MPVVPFQLETGRPCSAPDETELCLEHCAPRSAGQRSAKCDRRRDCSCDGPIRSTRIAVAACIQRGKVGKVRHPLQHLVAGIRNVLLTYPFSHPAAVLQKPLIEAPLVRAQWTAAHRRNGFSWRGSASCSGAPCRSRHDPLPSSLAMALNQWRLKARCHRSRVRGLRQGPGSRANGHRTESRGSATDRPIWCTHMVEPCAGIT